MVAVGAAGGAGERAGRIAAVLSERGLGGLSANLAERPGEVRGRPLAPRPRRPQPSPPAGPPRRAGARRSDRARRRRAAGRGLSGTDRQGARQARRIPPGRRPGRLPRTARSPGARALAGGGRARRRGRARPHPSWPPPSTRPNWRRPSPTASRTRTGWSPTRAGGSAPSASAAWARSSSRSGWSIGPTRRCWPPPCSARSGGAAWASWRGARRPGRSGTGSASCAGATPRGPTCPMRRWRRGWTTGWRPCWGPHVPGPDPRRGAGGRPASLDPVGAAARPGPRRAPALHRPHRRQFRH